MKKTNLVMMFNGGLVDSFKGKEDVVEWFKKERVSGLELEIDEESRLCGIEEGVDELIKMGKMNVSMECWNEELCEMGDEYVVIGVFEFEIK